jgi:beta-lactam-binding protein with PASTA domain
MAKNQTKTQEEPKFLNGIKSLAALLAALAALLTAGGAIIGQFTCSPNAGKDIPVKAQVVVVPDVRGLDYLEAIDRLQKSQLVPKINRKSVSRDFGKVLIQNPTGQSESAPNSTVELEVAALDIDSLIDLSKFATEQLLDEVKLSITSKRELRSTLAKRYSAGTVHAHNLTPHSLVLPREPVVLVMEPEWIEAPNVLGWQLVDAIRAPGVNIRSEEVVFETPTPVTKDIPEFRILRQDPPPKTPILANSRIKVTCQGR